MPNKHNYKRKQSLSKSLSPLKSRSASFHNDDEEKTANDHHKKNHNRSPRLRKRQNTEPLLFINSDTDAHIRRNFQANLDPLPLFKNQDSFKTGKLNEFQFTTLVLDLFTDEDGDEEEDKDDVKNIFKRISSDGQFKYPSKIDMLRRALKQQGCVPNKRKFLHLLLDCYEIRPFVTCDTLESADPRDVFTALAQQYEHQSNDAQIAKQTVNEMLTWFDRYAKTALAEHSRYQAENQALQSQLCEQEAEVKQAKEKESALLEEMEQLRESFDEQNDVKLENQELRTKLQSFQDEEEERVRLQTECKDSRQKIEQLQQALMVERQKEEQQSLQTATMMNSLEDSEQERKHLSAEFELCRSELDRLRETNSTLVKQRISMANKYTQDMEQKSVEFDQLMNAKENESSARESDMVKLTSSDESVMLVDANNALSGMMDEDDKDEPQCRVPMGRVRTLSWDRECDADTADTAVTEAKFADREDFDKLTNRLKMYQSNLLELFGEQRLQTEAMTSKVENKLAAEMKKMQNEMAELRKSMETKQHDEQDRSQRMQTAMQEVAVKVQSSTGEHVDRLQQALLSKEQFEKQFGALQETQLEREQKMATEFTQLRQSMQDSTETNTDRNGNIQTMLQQIATKMNDESVVAQKINGLAAELPRALMEVLKSYHLQTALQSSISPAAAAEESPAHAAIENGPPALDAADRHSNLSEDQNSDAPSVSNTVPYTQLKQEMEWELRQQTVAQIQQTIQASKCDIIESINGIHSKWYSYQLMQNESKEEELYAYNTDLNPLSDAEGASDQASQSSKPCVLQAAQMTAFSNDLQQIREDINRHAAAEQNQKMEVSEVVSSLKQELPRLVDDGVKTAQAALLSQQQSQQPDASQICTLIKNDMLPDMQQMISTQVADMIDASKKDVLDRIDGVQNNYSQLQQTVMETEHASMQTIMEKMDGLHEQYMQRQLLQKECLEAMTRINVAQQQQPKEDDDDDDDDDMRNNETSSQQSTRVLLQCLQPKMEEIIATLNTQQTMLSSVQNGQSQTCIVLQDTLDQNMTTMYSNFVQCLKQMDTSIVSKIFSCEQDKLSSVFAAIQTLNFTQNETLQHAKQAQQQGEKQCLVLCSQQTMVARLMSSMQFIVDAYQKQQETFTRNFAELQEIKRSKQSFMDSVRQMQHHLGTMDANQKKVLDRVQTLDKTMDTKLTRVVEDMGMVKQKSAELCAIDNTIQYSETLDNAIKLYIKEVDEHHAVNLNNMWQQLLKDLDAKNTTMGQWYLQQMQSQLNECMAKYSAK